MSLPPLATIETIVAFADTYQPPEFLPADHDAATSTIYTMAYCWGVKVGRDELDIDTAYVYARTRAEALEVHTKGARGWRDTMRLAVFLIDQTATRTANHLAALRAEAEHEMNRQNNARWSVIRAVGPLMQGNATPQEIEAAATKANGGIMPRAEMLAVLAEEWDRAHQPSRRRGRR